VYQFEGCSEKAQLLISVVNCMQTPAVSWT